MVREHQLEDPVRAAGVPSDGSIPSNTQVSIAE